MKPASVPVIIIGAGPVGVTAALLLSRHGVDSVLLERHHDIYPLPRAVATDDEVCRILQAAGIGERFMATARPARGLRLLDARHRILARFDRTRTGRHGYPQTSMFDQPTLERLLRTELATRPGCDLRSGAEVTAVAPEPGGRVRVTYRDGEGTHQLLAEAVLGCDGSSSLTRQAIGAGWEDLHFEERWTVLDVRTPLPVRDWGGVDQVCDPRQPATFMRISEDTYRWEFRLPDGEDLDGPDAQDLLRELVAPWIDLAPDSDFQIVRRAQYTFHARVADRWREGRIFLLGDAAHLTPPFIGQGLCSGLRDAFNLTWKLAHVLNQGADERLLDSYQDERRPHARHLIRVAVLTGWAMTGGQDQAAALRRAAVSAACRLPGSATLATRGLSRPLPAGPLTPRRVRRHNLVGTICPQPWTTRAGARTRLDDCGGSSFTLLTATALPPSIRAIAAGIGATVLDVHTLDDGGVLASWLHTGRADAALLRPDHVVLDVLPAGHGDFTSTTTWSGLLYTTRRPATASSPETAAASCLDLVRSPAR
ncbi:bifunctional 3-(3-hydroxy-phenyl)propionate/3-hydroxycinnamic acid hydroxylase [Streptomyces massasporeus]